MQKHNIVDSCIPRATEFQPNSGRIPGFTHNTKNPFYILSFYHTLVEKSRIVF